MRFFGKTNIDFMGKRRTWYMISLSVIVCGMISLAVKGVDYGIDFLGGTALIVHFDQAPDLSAVRGMMEKSGFTKVELKTFGAPNRIVIRTEAQGEGTSVGDKIRTALKESFPSNATKVLEEQKIGPKVGAELRAMMPWISAGKQKVADVSGG